MKKACLSILLLLALTLPATARKVRGTVEGDGVRLQNVIVTDGYRFTETDKQGRFRLNTHPDARYIAVVTPSGYVADYSSGVPPFFPAMEGRKGGYTRILKLGTRKGDGAPTCLLQWVVLPEPKKEAAPAAETAAEKPAAEAK